MNKFTIPFGSSLDHALSALYGAEKALEDNRIIEAYERIKNARELVSGFREKYRPKC